MLRYKSSLYNSHIVINLFFTIIWWWFYLYTCGNSHQHFRYYCMLRLSSSRSNFYSLLIKVSLLQDYLHLNTFFLIIVFFLCYDLTIVVRTNTCFRYTPQPKSHCVYKSIEMFIVLRFLFEKNITMQSPDSSNLHYAHLRTV